MWKRKLTEEQCANIRITTATSKWLRKPQGTPYESKTCSRESWVPVHHVACPKLLEGPSALSCSPPTMTYLALLSDPRPHPTPVQGMCQRSQQTTGCWEGCPLWEYKEALFFSVISHIASGQGKCQRPLWRQMIGTHLTSGSRSS